MIPGNWEPSGEKCLVGDNLRAAALAHAGWEWLDETKRGEHGLSVAEGGSCKKSEGRDFIQYEPSEYYGGCAGNASVPCGCHDRGHAGRKQLAPAVTDVAAS